MRRLAKEAKPAVLEREADSLTCEFAANPRTTPWKRREIVAALERETRGKCAYCEAKVSAVAWNHVEHVLPKSRFPHLVVEWSNLTIACPRCNVYKGDYADDEVPLLNPYRDQPSERLVFAFSLIRPVPGDPSSEVTVKILRLHRAELTEQRQAAVERLELLLQDWHRATEPLKEPIMEVIRDAVSDEAEFAGSLRSYLGLVGFVIPETPEIPQPVAEARGDVLDKHSGNPPAGWGTEAPAAEPSDS